MGELESQNRPGNSYLFRRFLMGLTFEWDGHKASLDVARYGVSFQEALTVFSDPLKRVFFDEDHSAEEQREIVIGRSFPDRLLLVCSTARGEWVRIFSTRRVTKRETRL